jgi:two-component system alkaline phosphatase synthesis response regulator PhoP
MHELILIIEDEESILMGLEDDLQMEGYQTETATDGIDGYKKAHNPDIDLILLDVMLPGMDGFTICRGLRQEKIDTPIIMLTAKGQEIDKVLGLEFGADDYVTKPFSLRELQARIKANLRRRQRHVSDNEVLEINGLTLDAERGDARLDGSLLDLTHLEFSILHYLALNEGRVINRHDILERVWGEDVVVSLRTVDTHIANLRKKIEADSASARWILGVRGIGYKFVRPSLNDL